MPFPLTPQAVQNAPRVAHTMEFAGSRLDLKILYVCMNGWVDGWMYGWMDVWMDVWMYGCMDVCIYLCMYVCMFACMYE